MQPPKNLMRTSRPLNGPMKHVNMTMRPDTVELLHALRMRLSIERKEKISLSHLVDELLEHALRDMAKDLQMSDHLAILPGL